MSVHVLVLYFSGLRERFTGTKQEEVEIVDGTTVGALLDELGARHQGLDGFRDCIRVAVNQEFVAHDHTLADDDEVALMPPVAGGSAADPTAETEPWCRLSEEPVDVGEVARAVARRGQGALVTFVGLVRDHNEGRHVLRLEYEAYEAMVLRSLADIVRRCEAAAPGVRVAVAHRTGTLAVGDIAVAIAASAPHRAEAFDAARACIELLKVETPIWKKETSPDGETWIGMTP